MTTVSATNHFYFAQAYGTGNYNSCTYGCTTGTGGTSGSGGVLANTGVDVLLVVTVACLIIFASLLVRFWRHPKQATKSLDSAKQTVLQSQQKTNITK